MVAMVTLGEKMTLILKAAYFFLESCGCEHVPILSSRRHLEQTYLLSRLYFLPSTAI